MREDANCGSQAIDQAANFRIRSLQIPCVYKKNGRVSMGQTVNLNIRILALDSWVGYLRSGFAHLLPDVSGWGGVPPLAMMSSY